jgi:hypothetical protein
MSKLHISARAFGSQQSTGMLPTIFPPLHAHLVRELIERRSLRQFRGSWVSP